MPHDIHIHTSLSACARPDAVLAGYLPLFPVCGVAVAGFSDHLWDGAVPGASDWYRPQDVAHVLPLKRELADAAACGVKLRFGCELEYIGNGVVSLHPDHAELFDFVLVSASHFHMKDFVRPASIDGGPELEELYYARFMDVCGFDFVTGIAHPFFPSGFAGREHEVLSLFSERRLETCFRTAQSCGKSIEINLAGLRKLAAVGVLADYRRIMRVAAGCGCRFHLGSDAHGTSGYGREAFALGEAFAADCGIRLPEDPFATDA